MGGGRGYVGVTESSRGHWEEVEPPPSSPSGWENYRRTTEPRVRLNIPRTNNNPSNQPQQTTPPTGPAPPTAPTPQDDAQITHSFHSNHLANSRREGGSWGGRGGYWGSGNYGSWGRSGGWNNDHFRAKDGNVPEWDGKSVHRTVYFRKIDLWCATAGIDPDKRALRLLQELKGQAFEKDGERRRRNSQI